MTHKEIILNALAEQINQKYKELDDLENAIIRTYGIQIKREFTDKPMVTFVELKNPSPEN